MGREGTHEQLVEGVEAAGDAGRKADKEDEEPLVSAELAHVREEVVKVHGFLRGEGALRGGGREGVGVGGRG